MSPLLERITSDKKILQGAAIVRGQSLSVDSVLGKLAEGATYETLQAQHPWLEPEDLQACLLFAQQAVRYTQPELTEAQIISQLPEVLEQIPYLHLLVLFGSRARGDSHFKSDWNFAVLFDEELRKQYEQEALSFCKTWRILQDVFSLSDNQIDVLELKSCDEIYAHRVAYEGKPLYEAEPSEFERFRKRYLKSPEQLRQWRVDTNRKISEGLKAS